MHINTLFLANVGANTHFCLPYPHWIFTGLTSLPSQLSQDILFYDTFSKMIEPHAKKIWYFLMFSEKNNKIKLQICLILAVSTKTVDAKTLSLPCFFIVTGLSCSLFGKRYLKHSLDVCCKIIKVKFRTISCKLSKLLFYYYINVI